MKNKNILPGQLVPENIRLEVYKEALEIMKSGEPYAGMKPHPYLQLLLPCVVWGLSDYLGFGPNRLSWNTYDANRMFPELISRPLEPDYISRDELGEMAIDFLLRTIIKLQGYATKA